MIRSLSDGRLNAYIAIFQSNVFCIFCAYPGLLGPYMIFELLPLELPSSDETYKLLLSIHPRARIRLRPSILLKFFSILAEDIKIAVVLRVASRISDLLLDI